MKKETGTITVGDQTFEASMMTLEPDLQKKDVTITENKTTKIEADSQYDGLEEVNVTTDVQGGIDPSGADAQPTDVAYGKTFYAGNEVQKTGTLEEYEGTTTITTNGTLATKDKIMRDNLNINVSGGSGTIAPNYVKFDGYRGQQSLDISWLRTPNIDTMEGMFANCSTLTLLDLSNFDTSNVTNMNAMFSSCPSLTSLDLSNFNTSNVTSMSSMFEACASLTSLDLSNFDTSNVTFMSYMFSDCNGLLSLDIRNFDFSSIDYDNEPGSVDSMFMGIPSNCVIYVNQAAYDFIENDFNGDGVMGLDDLSMLQVVS